jgi:hypothetical protein
MTKDDQLNVKPGTPLNMEIFLDSESAAIYGLLGNLLVLQSIVLFIDMRKISRQPPPPPLPLMCRLCPI